MGRAAREPPDEEGVDGAEGQLTSVGSIAGARHRVEDPGRLGAREVGVEDQAGARADELLVARLSERQTGVACAAALPDDGVVDGLAGRALPEHGRLTLVGDSDGGDAGGADACLGDGCRDSGLDAGPDGLGRMLHPARLGEDLGEFPIRRGEHLEACVEQHGCGAGGALIDGENEVRHAA